MDRSKIRSRVIGAIILISILLSYLLIFVNFIMPFTDKSRADEINFFLFIVTAILAGIAYLQFTRANELSRIEFLLFASNRWGEEEIIKARQTLHNLFVEAYRDKNSLTEKNYLESLHVVSKKVLELSEQKENKRGFIYLLSLLDFLEILGYFYRNKSIKLIDIQNICGNNLIFLDEVFRLFIERRRKHDNSAYVNFSHLINQIKDHKLGIEEKSLKYHKSAS